MEGAVRLGSYFKVVRQKLLPMFNIKLHYISFFTIPMAILFIDDIIYLDL